MIRAPPERRNMAENPVKIVRFSEAIVFESGVVSNMLCMGGPMEEVRERAEQIAKENNVEVVMVD